MSTVTMKYYKLGKTPSLFADARSGLKLTKGVPGAIPKEKVKGNKKIRNAEAQGAIISITEDQYDKMVKKAKSLHGKGLRNLGKPEAPEKKKAKKSKKKDKKKDGEDSKPLNEMSLDELEEEVKELEDITEEKVEKVMIGEEDEIIEFIENYNSDTDAELEIEDDDEDEELTVDDMRDKLREGDFISKKALKKLNDEEVGNLYKEKFPKDKEQE